MDPLQKSGLRVHKDCGAKKCKAGVNILEEEFCRREDKW